MSHDAGGPSPAVERAIAGVQDRLNQTDRSEEITSAGARTWVTVYESWHGDDNGAVFAMLSPPEIRGGVLSHDTWDLSIGDGAPGFNGSAGDEDDPPFYMRHGTLDGAEPLVLVQSHHDILPRMLPQLCEEFRLYHNLWLSLDGKRLVKLNDDGSEEVVAEIEHDRVLVRTKYLRQYQAGKQMDLVIFVDSVRVVDDPDFTAQLGELVSESTVDKQIRLSLEVSDRVYGRSRPFSRLLGKKVLPPPPVERAGIWPFDERVEVYPEFIIGEDADGVEVTNTCEPDTLANYFGANPDSPHYLAPVYFRRDVLQRYFEHPEKYSVGDGYLRCGGLWGVRIDNDSPHHVMVFLGDLGRDLPESERPYWRAFNVVPTAAMSHTVYTRSFLGEPAAPEAPDLVFKPLYERFKIAWLTEQSWSLFKDLHPEDEHVLQRLRVPLNQSQPEFEDQVLGLTKLLVDALDESALGTQLPSKIPDEKGIGKLERYLAGNGYPHVERDIAFLRRLQRLRTKLAAHRKGSDTAAFLKGEHVDDDRIREVVHLLWDAARFLNDLAEHEGLDLASV
jgi:hypothetical protein